MFLTDTTPIVVINATIHLTWQIVVKKQKFAAIDAHKSDDCLLKVDLVKIEINFCVSIVNVKTLTVLDIRCIGLNALYTSVLFKKCVLVIIRRI